MLIIPANSASASGYAVDNSCRFNSGSSDYLNRTPSAGNRRTWTWSAWVKRSTLGGEQNLLAADNNNRICFETVDSADQFALTDTNTSTIDVVTNQVFRDVSAWYHLVVAFDSTQATASNRVKLYVNGTQVTSLARTTYPSLNAEFSINNNSAQYIGRNSGGSNYFNGYMAETVFIDGSALTPTSFGEFDADSGAWKAIDVSGLTFGTNGFYLDFEDSAALGDDVSGNSNDFTVNNLTAIDQTTDTPTNNFCTMNPLDNYYANATFSEGNVVYSSARYASPTSTFAITQGKWYWEIKVNSMAAAAFIGITSATADATNFEFGNKSGAIAGWVYALNGAIYGNGGTPHGAGVFATYGAGDTLMMATDLDSNKIYFGKSGTWGNSQNPVDGTNSIAISALSTQTSGYYRFGAMGETGNATVFSWNFGNPAHTISSGNADGNGYGNFEYAVPSGYLALNTANLSEVLS